MKRKEILPGQADHHRWLVFILYVHKQNAPLYNCLINFSTPNELSDEKKIGIFPSGPKNR